MSHQQNSQAKKVRMLRLIEEQEQSGQSQIKFCKNQNLSIATFGYWRKKYLEEKSNRNASNFIPLKVKTPMPKDNPIEVELPNQIILRCTDWQIENLSSLIVELYHIGNKNPSC